MTVSRSEALLAYLACGYPEAPSERMLEYVALTVGWARRQSHSDGGAGPYPQHFQYDWLRAWKLFVSENDATQTLVENDLVNVALQGVKQSPTDYDTPEQFMTNVLGLFLMPVALYAYYDRHGILDTARQTVIARRTQTAIAEGTRVTICTTAPKCYRTGT